MTHPLAVWAIVAFEFNLNLIIIFSRSRSVKIILVLLSSLVVRSFFLLRIEHPRTFSYVQFTW